MKRRQWTGQQKLQIVLEAMRGSVPLGELCAKYEINQAQLYKWRDQLIQKGSSVFDTNTPDKQKARLEKENQKLKHMIGDLTVELKKTEYEL